MILVVGATGNNGAETIKLLTAKGEKVRAFVRDPEKSRSLLGDSVEMAQGDLAQSETFDAALEGVDRVFAITANYPGVADQFAAFLESAKRAGARHIVKFSGQYAALDSDIQFFRWHAQMEDQAKESGIPYTILQPNAFFQNLIFFSGPSIKAEGAIYGPFGNGRVSQVDVRDIAAVAAAVLTEDGHAGKTYEITGPEALSQYDIAQKVSAAIGKPVTYYDIPTDAYKQALLGYGVPEWLADDLVALDTFYARDGAKKVTNVVAEVAKKEPFTFDQFIHDHVGLFLSTPVGA